MGFPPVFVFSAALRKRRHELQFYFSRRVRAVGFKSHPHIDGYLSVNKNKLEQ